RRCPSLLSLTLMSVLLSPLSLQAADTLTVRAGMLNNQQGFMAGQKDMTLNAGTLDNRQGVLGSQASLQVSSGTLMNQKGA
ncbi:hypothetical protein, partial [Escherichia coli]|uniref:hypothetical protein n=1 Tax=Escherichia coli TaxID=562 RepID=UPI003CC7FB91